MNGKDKKYYKYRKLSKKESFDIATMEHFIPSAVKTRIYPNDRRKMADLSSKGVQPKNITKGFRLLQWGKTYRDEQITSYRRDIQAGLFTKYEILSSFPPRFRGYIWKKIEYVPYDIDAHELEASGDGSPVYRVTGRGSLPMLMDAFRKPYEPEEAD